MNNRVIFDDNGSQTDYTVKLDNYHGDAINFSVTAAEDAVYIGTDFPINSIYFKISTANATPSVLSMQYFNGSGWQNMNEIFDETDVSGATMAQSGHVTFIPNRDQTIGLYDTDSIDEIQQLIYKKYWYRLRFSVDCTFGIQWIGQIFTNDNDLGSEYPDLLRSNVLTSIESGKTDYEEQHVRAAEIVLDDLYSMRLINYDSQILRRKELRSASVSKVAEIIQNMRGEEYRQDREDAADEYKRRIRRDFQFVDSNSNGLVDSHERVVRNGYLRR